MNNNKQNYNIISISHYFYPRVGGLEKMAYGLLKYLSNNGYNCISIHGGERNKYYKLEKFDGLSIKTFSLFDRTYPIFGFISFIKIFNVIRKNKNATIIIHDRHLTSSLTSVAVCEILRRKYILVSHTTNSNFFKNKLLRLIGQVLDNTVFKYILKNASKIISVSETNKKYISKHLNVNPKKIEVIHNCFDSEIIKDFINDIKIKEKTVIFATKWIPVKNPQIVAEAFLQLSKKFPEWKFKFIGEGETFLDDMQTPENLIIRNTFLNQIDLFKELVNTSIYVNASKEEGMSVGVLEAAALGNITVLSNAKANIEVAKKLELYAHTFKKNNVNSLVKQLSKTIEQLDSKKYNWKQISKRAFKNFSIESSFKKYIQVLENENI